MAINSYVGNFAINTTSGSQAITSPSFQPKVVVFFPTTQTADGVAAHFQASIGIAESASAMVAATANSEDGQTTTDSSGESTTSKCIIVNNPGEVSPLYEADYTGATASGFNINVTTAPASAFRVGYWAIGGDDLTNVATGSFLATTSDGTQAITSPSFQPDAMLAFNINHNANTTTAGRLTVGCAVSASKRWTMSVFSDDGETTSNTARWGSSSAVFVEVFATGAERAVADFDSFTASGFVWNWTNAPPAADQIYYVCLKGGQYDAGEIQTQTSTGSFAKTGVGFQPVGGLFASNHVTDGSTASGNEFSLGIADNSLSQFAVSGNDENGQSTTDADSQSDDATIYLNYDYNQTQEGAISLTAFGTDGFTLDQTDADPSQYNLYYFVVGGSTAASTKTFVMDTWLKSQGNTVSMIMDMVTYTPTTAVATVVPVFDTSGIANYSVALMDSAGNTLDEIDDWQALSYTRAVNAIGSLTLQLDGNYNPFNYLKPDGRLAVWRHLKGRSYIDTDTTWLIRKIIRSLDKSGRRIITVGAVSANEILTRRIVAYDASASEASASSENADDLMKRIVRLNFSASATDGDSTRDISSYLSIAGDVSRGPAVTKDFSHDNVMDVLKEISQTAITSTSAVYFDIVSPTQATLEFRTYVGLRGIDHSFPNGNNPVILSTERGNLTNVDRAYDWTKEYNFVYASGASQLVQSASSGDRINISVLNRREVFVNANNSSGSEAVIDEAQAGLREGRPRRLFDGELVNVPGATEYGVHWGLGDMVTADFEGESADCIIDAVTISVKNSKEDIKGTLRVQET